jgi:hypothetical protein
MPGRRSGGARHPRTTPGRTSRPGRPGSPPVLHRGLAAPPSRASRSPPTPAPRSVAEAASARGSASRHTRPARVGRGLADTCPADASPGAVLDHVGPGPAQIPHRLLGHGRDADGDQFPGPVQPGQPPAVPTVGLGPRRRGPWGSARGRSPHSALRCGAAAGPARSRSGRPGSRLATGGDHQGGQRACAPTPRRGRPARRQAYRGPGPGSPPRWCPCARLDPGGSDHDGCTGHGRLLPYVAPAAGPGLARGSGPSVTGVSL